jgi:hypothetical protein
MTIKVELDPELEARLEAEARAQGLSSEEVAKRILDEALASRITPKGNLTVKELHEMLHAIAEGSENLPDIPTSAFARESFYEDRD